MAINSRLKGRRGEQQLAAFLRERGYGDARRGRQYSGDPSAPDVLGLDGFHIECKHVEKLNIHEAYAQACADCGLNIPLVVHRRSRGEWMVTLTFDKFLTLIK